MNNRISFYTPPYPRAKSYIDMIDLAVEHGLSLVEGLSTMEFSAPDVEKAKKIKEYADSKNIKFPCFSVFINLGREDSREMIERLKAYADVAKTLGSPYLHHTIIPEFSHPDRVLPFKEELFEKGIKAVREIYDYCEEIGIKAIYEPQGFIFNGIENLKRFANEVERDIMFVADFTNICQSGDRIEDFIKAFPGKIAHAHIKDAVLSDEDFSNSREVNLKGGYVCEVETGKGEIDIKGIIKLLDSFGYKGAYALEYGVKDDNSDGVKNALKVIDEALS